MTTQPKPPDCPLCKNTGRVMCWHPRDVDWFTGHRTMPRSRSGGFAYVCNCGWGKPWHGKYERYDQRRHVRLHKGRSHHPQSEANLRAWVESKSTSGVFGVEDVSDGNF